MSFFCERICFCSALAVRPKHRKVLRLKWNIIAKTHKNLRKTNYSLFFSFWISKSNISSICGVNRKRVHIHCFFQYRNRFYFFCFWISFFRILCVYWIMQQHQQVFEIKELYLLNEKSTHVNQCVRACIYVALLDASLIGIPFTIYALTNKLPFL